MVIRPAYTHHGKLLVIGSKATSRRQLASARGSRFQLVRWKRYLLVAVEIHRNRIEILKRFVSIDS